MEDSIKELIEFATKSNSVNYILNEKTGEPYGLRISYLSKKKITKQEKKFFGLNERVKEFSLLSRYQLIYVLAFQVGQAKHYRKLYETVTRDETLRDEFFLRNKKPAIIVPFKKNILNQLA